MVDLVSTDPIISHCRGQYSKSCQYHMFCIKQWGGGGCKHLFNKKFPLASGIEW